MVAQCECPQTITSLTLSTRTAYSIAAASPPEPDDPIDYDLCVNTSSLPLEAAAKLLVAAYHERFPAEKR